MQPVLNTGILRGPKLVFDDILPFAWRPTVWTFGIDLQCILMQHIFFVRGQRFKILINTRLMEQMTTFQTHDICIANH